MLKGQGSVTPKPLQVFLTVLLLLVLASLLDTGIGYKVIGRGALTYLFPYQLAVDFYIYNLRVPMLHTPGFFTGPAFPWMYPAPSIFVYLPFYHGIRATHWHANYIAFLTVAVVLDGSIAVLFSRALVKFGLKQKLAVSLPAASMLLGWPLYFAFQRGNIESYLWIGIAAGVFCFAKEKNLAAALFIGVIGSAKLYPLLLLALFLKPKHLRYLALGLAAAGMTTLVALRFLEPNIRDAYKQISMGVRLWTQLTTMKYGTDGIGPDHSIFGLLRMATGGGILRVPHILGIYLIFAGVIATAAFLLTVRLLPAVNQVLFLVCAAVLLPPTSFDYTLLLLFIPWAWVVLLCVEAARRGCDLGQFRTLLLLFGVALAPMTFLHTYGNVQIYFEGPVRCLALVSLALFAAWKPLSAVPAQAASPLPLPS